MFDSRSLPIIGVLRANITLRVADSLVSSLTQHVADIDNMFATGAAVARNDLLEDALALSSYQGWCEDVYRDFLALQQGEVSTAEFREKYSWQRAILSLDMTGFTSSAIHLGELESFLRVVDMQKVCIPVLQEFESDLVRCFADDIVALFADSHAAIDAAFEIHRRVERFRNSPHASDHPSHLASVVTSASNCKGRTTSCFHSIARRRPVDRQCAICRMCQAPADIVLVMSCCKMRQ